MNEFINQYLNDLLNFKFDLIRSVEAFNPIIETPTVEAISEVQPSATNSNLLMKGSALGGITIAVIGIFAKSPTTIIIGGVLACGSFYFMKKSSKQIDDKAEPTIDYHSISSSLIKEFRGLQSEVFNKWNDYLTSKRDLFINNMDIISSDSDVQNQIRPLAFYKSVVDIPISSWTSRLIEVSHKGDLILFNGEISGFKSDSIKAIERAYDDQKAKFDEILQILSDNNSN
jgi:hypothetical protein